MAAHNRHQSRHQTFGYLTQYRHHPSTTFMFLCLKSLQPGKTFSQYSRLYNVLVQHWDDNLTAFIHTGWPANTFTNDIIRSYRKQLFALFLHLKNRQF